MSYKLFLIKIITSKRMYKANPKVKYKQKQINLIFNQIDNIKT